MDQTKLTYAEKSERLLEETLDSLRNKPVNSTYLERLILADRASALYREMPQPLRMGYCMNYILENASCPVEPQDILMGRYPECIPTEEEEKQFAEIVARMQNGQLFMIDWGHTTFDWEEILRLGISGYIQKSEEELQRRLAMGAEAGRILFLQGMNLVYRSYRRYICRYAQQAEIAGNPEAAQACRNLADNPPSTFLEAVQLILFIVNTYSIYSASANATLTCGRMDDLLLPYYEADVRAGRLTREEAGYIIDDFNCKNSLILGRGEHQMSGGSENDTGWQRNPMYDSPTYVLLGGYSNKHSHRDNPLTTLFLERIQPRFENPVYVFRRTADVTEENWRLVCDKMRKNSTLLVYNDETVIPSLLRAGVERYDAVNYNFHGCNWPDTQGLNVNELVGGPIPRLIMESLFDADGNPQKDFPTMDAMYAQIGATWRAEVRRVYQEYRQKSANGPLVPTELSCIDCFKRGTLENAASARQYAVKYTYFLSLLRNIGTAADMMSAMDTVIFGADAVPVTTLADALKSNFVGYEDLWKRCKNAPKFGQDQDAADQHAVRLLTMLTDITHEESVNPETGIRDVYAPSVTITDMWHIQEGQRLSATPDGRLAGMPLSENLSPSVGASQSVTALLNSVAKLPMDRFSSGVLNVRMPKNLVSGDAGLERLMILLETYFENGGMQLQLNVADTEELRDAQVHPENYRDLMVRITGYSAVFVDMCTRAQNEIIRRDEVS